VRFTSLVSQIGKPQNAAEALVNRTSRWIVKHFGVSMRTAQRWKKGTQQPGKRVGGPEQVTKSANAETRRTVAAQAMRGTTAVNVGRVEVVDKSPRGKGPKPGKNFRTVGVVQLDERSRERMAEAADALEAGDTERAGQLMSEAVLRTSGKDYGGALEVADWPAHFHLI
jgi:hypothetical protein